MALKSDFGLELDVPDGWYGEIFRVDEPGDSGPPVLHVANTPLILGERNAYAAEARQAMRANDAILCVINQPSLPNLMNAPGVANLGAGRRLTLQGASDTPFHGVGNGYSSLRKATRVGDRLFDVIAFFAQATPPPTLQNALEAILGSIVVASVPPIPGRRIEQFFDSAAAARINGELVAEFRALETA